MSKSFVGRQQELSLLDELWGADGAKLLILYGRRRIGKTRLLTQWLQERGHRTLYWVASPPPPTINYVLSPKPCTILLIRMRPPPIHSLTPRGRKPGNKSPISAERGD